MEQYNGLVDALIHTDYTPQEYIVKEKQLAKTLLQMNGKLSLEHLDSITRVTQVLTTEAVMIPMAKTISNIDSDASFNYLLEQFLDCFEDGKNESTTAEACYQAMLKLDPMRVERDGINLHPHFL